jgi:Ca-activated chloride channel family protein
MSFIWPPLLLTLLLVPLGAWVAWRIERGRRVRMGALAGLGGAAAATREEGRGHRLTRRLATGLAVGAFVLLCVAMARPQASVSLPRSEGIVMLTFDVSGSMAATDVEPSRMEQAKAVATAFVAEPPPGVLVGVVAFSDGGLAVQVPTDDVALLTRAIDRLTPSLGTSLGEGMLAALEAIRQAESDVPAEYYSNRTPDPAATAAPAVPPGSHDSASIVLLSDGENTSDPGPLEIAQAAAERGIRIHTVGVGTEQGAVLDLDGFQVQTALDRGTLEGVAALTAAAYHPAAEAEASLAAVYTELGRRLSLREEPIEITGLVAAAGLILLAIAGLLSLVRGGRLP